MSTPEPTSDRHGTLALIAAQQGDPATACGYVGTLDEDLEADLDGLDQPWLGTLRVCRDAGGSITGAACIEWDEEVDTSWVYGPWCTETTWHSDAAGLVAAVVAQAPVSRHRLYADVANTRLAALAGRLGWRAGSVNHVCAAPRAALARPDVAVRPATPADLPALRALHTLAFPGTYATAEQLVAPDGDYTTLVLHEDGRLLGYAAGKRDGEDAYLDLLATEPSARRRGVGRRLLGAFAAVVPGQRVRLTVDEEKAPEAIALYDALGFIRLSATRGYTWTGPSGTNPSEA